MKINKIKLTNIRSHVDTEIPELRKLTIFRGDLNQGKSSIEMAIEVLLTGRCEVTNDKGDGQSELIRKGCDKAAITMQLQNADQKIDIRCSLTEKSGRNMTFKDPNDDGYDATKVQEFLKNNRDVLSCLCNNRFFMRQDPKEQKRILASIILPSEYEWPKTAMQACAEAELTIPWKEHPFAVIEKAYKAAFEARTNVNRDIKNWVNPQEARTDTLSVTQARENLAAVNERYHEAQGRRTALFSEAGEANRNRDFVLGEIGKWRTEIASLEQEREQMSAAKLSDDHLKKLKKTAGEKERAGVLDDKISRCAERMKQIKEESEALDAISELPKCPKCQQAITPSMLEKLFDALTKENNEVITAHREAFDARKEIGDYVDAAAKIAAHAEANKDLKRVDAKLEELRKKADDAEFNLPAVTAGPDSSKVDAEIAQIQQDMNASQNDLVAASQAETMVKLSKEAFEKREALDARATLLNRLVDYFGPEGIKAKLIDEHVGPFLDKMNTVLSTWGYNAFLEIEPYRFMVTKLGEHGWAMNLRNLSKSEQYRFGIAFQVALAAVTGIRFCVVDESDTLTPDARGGLMVRMMDSEDIDQIIVIGTDQRREVAEFPDTIFYWVEDPDGKGAKVEMLREEVPA